MGYGKVSGEAIQNDYNRLNGGGGNRWHKVPQEGEMVFFCPPWNDKQTLPYHEVSLHYGLTEGPVLCLKSINQVCPICVANMDLFNNKEDPAAQKISSEIYAKRYYIYQVIPGVGMRNANGVSYGVFNPSNSIKEPKIEPYLVGIKLHKQLCSFYASYSVNIFDPMNGHIVQLVKVATGSDPKYAATMANVCPTAMRLEDSLMKLLDGLHDLSKEVTPMSTEQVQTLIDAKLATFRAMRNTVYQGSPQATPQFAPVNTVPPQSNFVFGAAPSAANSVSPVPSNPAPANVTPTFMPPSMATGGQSNLDRLKEFEAKLAKTNPGG